MATPNYITTQYITTPITQPDNFYQIFERSLELAIERDIAGYALSLNVSPNVLDVFASSMRIYISQTRHSAQEIYKFAIELAYNLSKLDEKEDK